MEHGVKERTGPHAPADEEEGSHTRHLNTTGGWEQQLLNKSTPVPSRDTVPSGQEQTHMHGML